MLFRSLKTKTEVFGVIYLDGSVSETKMNALKLPIFEILVEFASELLGAAEDRRRFFLAKERLLAYQSLQEEEDFIAGEGKAGQQLKSLISAAAPKDVAVLLTGETGVGKEMVARAVHRHSTRAAEPFIPVNCAALPADLIEAELFGAEKGAYTGADTRRLGRFELAGGGTLFLDEVGELPLEFQVKLLRVLQERKLCRVGGSKVIPLSFRLICATNKNLEESIERGLFRQDFYYRINVFRIHLPPLRERVEDILPLARYFLAKFNRSFNKRVEGFSSRAEKVLLSYSWPGNVRELRNAVERALVIEESNQVSPKSLPFSSGESSLSELPLAGSKMADLPKNYDEARAIFESSFLQRSFQENDGNIAAMARQTGIPRNTVYRRLEKYGLLKKP